MLASASPLRVAAVVGVFGLVLLARAAEPQALNAGTCPAPVPAGCPANAPCCGNGAVYCTSVASQLGPQPCPIGAVPLSPFTETTFVPDGEICEFIEFAPDPQGYFLVDPVLGENFGAIRAASILTPGVLVARDNFPESGLNAAGPTGHADPPCIVFAQDPTGFNPGRVFASFNPRAYGGEGAYFLAMDVSAPQDLDTANQTQAVAFDVDGDGSRCTQSEPQGGETSEAPIKVEDFYTIVLDTNRDSIPDIRIRIGESVGFVPFGSVAIDPGGVPQCVCDDEGTQRSVRRFLRFEDLTGTLPGSPLDQAVRFLDANDDGILNHLDIGVDSDIELVVRDVVSLPRSGTRPFHAACGRFTFLADSFYDVFCGGAEERVDLTAAFPVPDIEVTKEARCLNDPTSEFRRDVEVTPGSTVEFRVSIQNWGNAPLDVKITDVLTGLAPATTDLIEGQCRVVGTNPVGVLPDFCSRFEAAINAPASFPINVGRLQPNWFATPETTDDGCAVGPGERLVFTFQVVIGPEVGSSEFCDEDIDVTNVVSVSGTLSAPVDPVLPPSGLGMTANGEEQDCVNGQDPNCCATAAPCVPLEVCQGGVCIMLECPPSNCVPGDGIGDLSDEFFLTVYDLGGMEDTLRELVPDADSEDDNVVTISIRCRSITLAKEVRETTVNPNAPFVTGETSLDVPSAPADIEYRFTVVNGGEVDESVTLTDTGLCADLAAVAAAYPGRVSFADCDLCDAPTPGELTVVVGDNSTFTTFCRIHFDVDPANPFNGPLEAFMRADDARPVCTGTPFEVPVACYRNCASVSATATNLDLLIGSVCPDGPITDDSFATVCHFPCEIEVTKQVRCLDNCSDKNVVGSSKDSLQTTRNSCVEYVVSVQNTDLHIPICRLRLDDVLADQPACVTFDDHVRFSVGGTDCPVPACFNVTGAPCDWDPTTCGLSALDPGETLTITFNATIPPNAPLNCGPFANTIEVQAASDCRRPQQPGFTCADQDSASVDLLEPSLACLGKEWAFQWDSDADCQPEAPFSTFQNEIDLRDKVFPVQLRLRVRAQNTGQVSLDVVAVDPQLACVCATPGVTCDVACEIGETANDSALKQLAAGQSAEWLCDIRVDTAEAMRDLDTCDGATDSVYTNRAGVSGRLTRGMTNVCVPEDFNIVGGETNNVCRARIQVPEPCEFTVTKQVKCADDPDNAYAASVDALAGSRLTYRIQVRNDDPRVKIPRICIDDDLTCPDWLVAGSVVADINGANVAACLSGFEPSLSNGNEVCYTFAACRAAAPWIAPNETLTIKFDVRVPVDFDLVGTDPDCENDVAVESYSEVCVPSGSPDPACDVGSSHAEFDVLIPDMNCDKQVGADLDNDGDLEVPFTHDLSLPCDTVLPFTLEYRFTVTNKGETPLTNVQICDPELVADARAAGLTVGPCALCNAGGCDGVGDTCAPLPAIPVGAPPVTAVCRIRVPNRAAWEAFAGRDTDGDANRYANSSSASANVNTAAICDFQANTAVTTDACSATAFLAPLCQLQVTKQAVCLDNCTAAGRIGNPSDVLEAATGSCVEFTFNVTNTSSILPICRLRLTDTLTGQPGNILFSGGTTFSVGATSCPVPAGFNVTGTPFDWDPTTCGLPNFGPNQVLTVSFRATIPLTADTNFNPLNSVVVNGAPTCPASPNFCCSASADAEVNILRPRLTCTGKEWAFQWDSDGDCLPEAPFSPFSNAIDLRDKVFPALLRLRISASNTGEVPLDVTVNDPTMACVCAVPGVVCTPGDCELSVTKRIAAGGNAQWTCDLAVESAEAMRDVAACDGSANLTYVNTASVSGRLVRADTAICVPENRVIPGDATCGATIQVPPPCDFSVDKQIKCADEPDLAYGTDIEMLPNSVVRYRIRVTNQSTSTKLPRVCIRDLLECCTWFVPASVQANINGHNVTACISPEFENALCSGVPECYTFADCRPAAPWIAPNETLTIIFDVQVPDLHPKEPNTDCDNDVEVDGFTEVCPPTATADDACNSQAETGHAEFDVLFPGLECTKAVGADLNNDGALELTHTANLLLPCDTAFPFTLEYKWSVENTGETPLIGVQICDPDLRPDAVAAGLTILGCDIPATPEGCANLPVLPEGGMGMATCRVRIPNRAAWQIFAGRDVDSDEDCYTNESSSRADVDARDVCAFGAEPEFDSEPCSATACLAPVCTIDVTKQVRCLDNCEDANPIGNLADEVPAVPGSCLQYQFAVRNTSTTDPVCRLRICDMLSGTPGNIAFDGNVRCKVGNVDCPVPTGFNVNGTCFEWDPSECGLTNLGPGESLTCTFDASIPPTADPNVSPVNTVMVSGAPTCKGGRAQYCCQDSEDARVDIKRPALRCDGKEWAVQWDSDCDTDCSPDAPFSSFTDNLDLRDKIFPALLRLRIRATNNGEVPVLATVEDPTLLTCAGTTPGVTLVDPLACELGDSKNIAVNGSAEWICDVRVNSADAMRELAACDGTDDGIYTNKAILTGLVKAGTGGTCVPDQGMVTADNQECAAIIRAPGPCRFELQKTAICTSGCGSANTSGSPAEMLEALPGSTVRFNVAVTNTDPLVKIPRLCLTDVVSCAGWICPNSLKASLAGTDISGGLACQNDPGQAFEPDGQRCCISFCSRPAAPWIAPNETLVLSFDVHVPESFDTAGVLPDCTNNITVESFTERCAVNPAKACALEEDSAAIDVQVPKLECEKKVAIDLGNDGTVDIAEAPSVTVSNPPFPVRLIYTFTATNRGDTPIANVSICDQELIADARAAGLTVGPCELCNDAGCDGGGDTCKNLGGLNIGVTRSARCEIIVTDQDAWEAFADRDGPDARRDCYVNQGQASGSVSGRCVAPGTTPVVNSQPCEATVCMNIVQRCPVTKAVFDIWNQNERRFSGTERCIPSWDQTLLSRYTEGNIANHFQRTVLQTERGKARIDGVASGVVCGPGSVNAPLLGVAARIVNFGRDGIEYSGRNLVGSGTEAGSIFYDPILGAPLKGSTSKVINANPDVARPNLGYRAEAQTYNRASETNKGSLLVFPKVEVKWNAAGEVVQDTFISLSNDVPEAVLVQMYFVNGDQATEAETAPNDPSTILERAHLGCNWVDNLLQLTANQPVYWSVLTGDPQSLSPFTILDPGDPPGRPDTDPWNPGGRVLRGYILAWAVNVDSQEIRWNHLTGEAMIINYEHSSAWDYHPWAFQALAGAANGSLLNQPTGRLDLDGVEYDAVPATLIFDFLASGTQLPTPNQGNVTFDTDLTLWVATKDLRNP